MPILNQELQPVSELLDEHDVPFAFVAIGAENQVLDRHPMLNNRPRIHRPYHGPTLHAAARSLYGDSVTRRIARVDRHLAEGKARLARQIALIERLAAAGADTSTADALAREYGRALKARRLWGQHSGDFGGRTLSCTAWAEASRTGRALHTISRTTHGVSNQPRQRNS